MALKKTKLLVIFGKSWGTKSLFWDLIIKGEKSKHLSCLSYINYTLA
jgi:hypothetical protein